MAKDYTKVLKHIENVVVVSSNPSTGNADPAPVGMFPLVHSGFLEDGETKISGAKNEIREAGGSKVQLGYDLSALTKGLEVDSTELAVLETFEKASCHFFLFGRDQSHRLKNVTPVVNIDADLSAKGKSLVGIEGKIFTPSLSDVLELNGSPTFYSTNPAYKYNTIINKIRRDNLEFEVYPYLGNFGVVGTLYDASKSRRNSILAGGPTWTSPYLVFDGVNDKADFGNILNIDSTSDFLIEAWLRPQAANAVGFPFLGKKTLFSPASVGWSLERLTSNLVRFHLSDGAVFGVVDSASTLLQNVAKHVAIAGDRNGNGQMYFNGVADGAPVSLAGVGNSVTSASFLIGAVGATFGQHDVGMVRVSLFGAGGLPSNIAAIITAHFNAERAEFGV